MRTLVIAIGGNSLIKDAQHMSVADQYDAVVETARHIAGLVEDGNRVVITHGNGPQVGFILRRSEYSRGILHQVPLDSIVADTQGALGYQIQQALRNEFHRRHLKHSVATVVTQTIVDRNDPAFKTPSKPIGQFYSEAEAADRMKVEKWVMAEDAGRGWRRLVASPRPLRIVESEIISLLVQTGCVVIAVGGGGIPVVDDGHGAITGVAAVIDKDAATAVLAGQIRANSLVISTSVPSVFLNFGLPNQRQLDTLTAGEARTFLPHFHTGSMLPKVEACLDFLAAGGEAAFITCPADISAALRGTAGTRIVR